jgi:mRNA interferase YafQ
MTTRRIEITTAFKRDFKKVRATPKHRNVDTLLQSVLNLLSKDIALSRKHFDHSLTGEWKDHRDCHIKPDLVLIYRKVNHDILQLVRLGSHSELSL